ncbi:MAG: response regulator, partial [candidate division WOR-3 bacterium]|nr:response regulator [candidate division WOR-3 bacterium]
MKLLVVEDNERVRKAFVDILEEFSYRCTEASNGTEAIEKYSTEHYDCVLGGCTQKLYHFEMFFCGLQGFFLTLSSLLIQDSFSSFDILSLI